MPGASLSQPGRRKGAEGQGGPRHACIRSRRTGFEASMKGGGAGRSRKGGLSMNGGL